MKHCDAASQSDAIAALSGAILWAEKLPGGISTAAYTDNLSIDECKLIDCLSPHERDKALLISDPADKRHYIVRRCFQRIFVKTLLNWQGKLCELEIQHQLDTQPQCLDAPNLRLSFSTSGLTAVACASSQFCVGIDIEKRRLIENAQALAKRFFSPQEAKTLATIPVADQETAFLMHWTAKEAGLKAIGKGIVSGLNSFTLSPREQLNDIEIIEELNSSAKWHLNFPCFVPDHIVAVVHNSEN